MSRPDYDDMITDNNSRGKKATRSTILAVLFVILVVLIVLVIYLIANPGKKLDITEKKEEVTLKKEETPSLFLFDTSSSLPTSGEDESPAQLIVAEPEVTVEEAPEAEGEIPLVIIGEGSSSVEKKETSSEIVPHEEIPVETVHEETPVIEESVEESVIDTPLEETPVIEETAVTDTALETPAAEEKILETPIENTPETLEENPLLSLSGEDVVASSNSYFDNGSLVVTGNNGSAVHSVAAGTVSLSGKENGMKYIVIEDSEGNSIRYSGFERVTVRLKDRVKKGEILGSIGSSSFSRVILTYTEGKEE